MPVPIVLSPHTEFKGLFKTDELANIYVYNLKEKQPLFFTNFLIGHFFSVIRSWREILKKEYLFLLMKER